MNQPTSHPLDPLTGDEIRQVAAILGRDRGVDDGWRYASIELREPPKDAVRIHDDNRDDSRPDIAREARVVCWDREHQLTFKAVVSLTDDRVVSWHDEPDEQPNMTVDEWNEAQTMLLAHPDVIAALAKRGITDLETVVMDTWTYGHALIPEELRGRRLGWTDTWYRSHPGGNPYANPVNGLHFVIDMNTMELLRIEDTFEVAKPNVMGEYVPGLVPGLRLRDDVKPLDIVQADGPSFSLDGNALAWQGWSMRIGFNYREGLVLHRVGYADAGGDVRSIAHRLSFAEMIVPYRDPGDDHYRRTAFDVGEWGLGFMTTSLELGCDCLGEIRYLDATLHDSRAEPYTIANAVCIHEEDDAVLWKHVDNQAGAEVRRSRRLVISFHATVANYEYLVYWRFYQDGTIEAEIRATGIMVVSHVDDQPPAYGTLVDERTYAPFHQHFVVARLDMEVDGTANTVYETQTEALPISADNPYGLALVQRSTPIRTEAEGARDYDWATQRSWKVVNDGKLNGLGTPVAYKIVPTGCFPPMVDESSPVFQRAQVIGHTLWVTRFDEEQRWPCGEFCNQSSHDQGLPQWMEADRGLVDEDVVLWYVFGIHHITRPEDWPVMPVDVVSFSLKPIGFFDRNPSLDVPPSAHHC
ncbi:MAG TPA: primary-amine oxidase [Nocardioidaceae bacterium]|nr:primary-amine oxidase [Nocardioidaceae bacterium]